MTSIMGSMSYAGVSPRLIKYHANYLITTDDIDQSNDIVASENSHFTINNYSYTLNAIYAKQLYI